MDHSEKIVKMQRAYKAAKDKWNKAHIDSDFDRSITLIVELENQGLVLTKKRVTK